MSWKGRLALIATAWIVVPWTWGIVATVQRQRREGDDDGGSEGDGSS